MISGTMRSSFMSSAWNSRACKGCAAGLDRWRLSGRRNIQPKGLQSDESGLLRRERAGEGVCLFFDSHGCAAPHATTKVVCTVSYSLPIACTYCTWSHKYRGQTKRQFKRHIAIYCTVPPSSSVQYIEVGLPPSSAIAIAHSGFCLALASTRACPVSTVDHLHRRHPPALEPDATND